MALLENIRKLVLHDAAQGVFLLLAAVAAFVIANSPWAEGYQAWLSLPLTVSLGENGLSRSLLLWINDGLMAVFFFHAGLELKREMLEGRLRHPSKVALPGLAALGGMAVPALIYWAINLGHGETLQGWAIPSATDIAFAIGVVGALGKAVPPSLKLFLLTLAILDDLGAILIIAFFYGHDLAPGYLLAALLPLAGMLVLNLRGQHRITPILLLGVVLWVLVLRSGIHPTIAGVLTALMIPLRDRWGKSPLHALENGLSPYVYFGIVPLFAFANAGVSLAGLSLSDLLSPLPVGVALGLFLGKQIGVFGTTALLVRSGIAPRPEGANWMQIWGAAVLAGIGFTMSLFIGALSFSEAQQMNEVRLGVLIGSCLSAIAGFIILKLAARPAEKAPAAPRTQARKSLRDSEGEAVAAGAARSTAKGSAQSTAQSTG